MKRICLSLLLSFFCALTLWGQSTFKRRDFHASDGTVLNYREMTPDQNAKGKKFPLIIFLHGLGERGTDNELQLYWGSQMFLEPSFQKKYPSYVIFPQCPETAFWAYDNIPASYTNMKAEAQMPAPMNAVKELIDTYISFVPDVDRSRIYIMGLSMGGCATYDMVARFPDIFAAAIPMCGAVEPERLENIEGVSFRIFHGDDDTTIPVQCSRDAYAALRKAGADVEYIEIPGCGHGCWKPAFAREDFMEWLFKQKKPRKYLK